MSPWLILAGAGAGAGALGAGCVCGRMDGQKIEQAGQLCTGRAVAKACVELQGKIDRSGTASAERETRRQSDVREVYPEMEKIGEWPVYSTRCIDAGGVCLLGHALPSLMVRVSPHLLAEPAKLPLSRRTAEGEQLGSLCLSSLLDVYDVARRIRATLIELQGQVRRPMAAAG